MIQLSAEQLLQIALSVSCGAVALVAGVFLLVLHATRRRRGLGWFWGWTFLSVTFGLLALAQHFPRFEVWLGFAAAGAGIVAGSAGVAGAYSFRNAGRMPSWTIAVLALAAIAALLTQWRAGILGDFVAPEIPFAVSLIVQAAVIFPMARTARMSGLQTALATEIVLGVMLMRTLVSVAILAFRGQELTEIYWTIEVIGGMVLSFVLAMGELIAMLDEVRVDLEGANEALNQALEGLEIAAKLDPLTGLYNRYAFYALAGEFAERGKMGGSIAIIDLNGLKRINDTYGHHAGDRALLNVAMRLQEVVRQSDYVFRWGGDEFVVLLFGMPPDAARDRMTHMTPPADLDLPEHDPVPLRVSWGVAPLEPDVDAALRDADAHLYAQKRLFTRAAGTVPSP